MQICPFVKPFNRNSNTCQGFCQGSGHQINGQHRLQADKTDGKASSDGCGCNHTLAGRGNGHIDSMRTLQMSGEPIGSGQSRAGSSSGSGITDVGG